MAVTVVSDPSAAKTGDDFVSRMQVFHASRQDEKDEFKNVEVAVEDGPPDGKSGKRPMSAISLRYALDQPYIFAVYAENPAFQARGFEEWRAVAADAIQKHAALNGLAIKMGPRSEDGMRYNIMAELDKPVEVSERALRIFAEQAAEREKAARRRQMFEELGMA